MNATDLALAQPAADPRHWLLDPAITFLNHGSFGACPRPVLAAQTEWRAQLEQRPVDFLVRELEPRLDAVRATLADFVGAAAADLVFVNNATTGVNTVLRSLPLAPGDELIVTDQEYNACRNALNYAAERSGARVVVVTVPFPFKHAEEVLAPVLAAVTPRTRLLLIDHITSQTGAVLPLGPLVAELNRRGVDTLVDGAHAPGQVPLNLNDLGAAYYTGNCHKWLCTPKGVALLHVRQDRQSLIRPLTISHGANSRRQDRSRFWLEFDWAGTWDPSAVLSLAAAGRFMEAQLPGGWPAVMARNRALALAARQVLCAALSVPEPCPAEYIGSMATVPLPPAPAGGLPELPFNEWALQTWLRQTHRIEVPLVTWPAAPRRWVRVSAQLYNSLPQYERLAAALRTGLAEGR